MRQRIRMTLAAAVAMTTLACSDDRSVSPTGPTSTGGVVVESTKLDTHHGEGYFDSDECRVNGWLRNDDVRDHTVTLVVNALHKNGSVMDTATTRHNSVPAGERRTFQAIFYRLSDCDDVKGLEVAEIILES